MRKRLGALGLGMGIVCTLLACAPNDVAVVAEETRQPPREQEPREKPLRVGITPESPPLIFTMGGKASGVEADLAREVATRLGRELRFVELPWDGQIQALLEGRIDIIMSGMSVTEARQVRIDFSEPYFKTSLFALVRSDDAYKYPSRDSIFMTDGDVGVQKDTTGDVFVQRNLAYARRWSLSRPRDAALELSNRKIDLFVHDGPVVAWLASENEATLTVVGIPLSQEIYAWGIRRGDEEFRATINKVLKDMKEDGTLERILKHWLPYLESIRS